MTITVTDLLTVIPKKDILKKGIPYVKHIICKKHKLDSEDKAKWSKF